MSELFELGKEILESQPFSALLGTELEVFEPGTAVLTLAVREELKQQHGFVHGGVLSYLADNALTYAGGSVLGDSVTSEYKINYIEIPSRDLEATKRFFGDAFGWSFVDYGPEYVAIENAGLDGGFFKSDNVATGRV